jgi:hypothetical protein
MEKSIHDFCEILVNRQEPVQSPELDLDLRVHEHKCAHLHEHEHDTPIINRQDVENLANYVKIWTDMIDYETVQKQFKISEFTDLKQFELLNNLTNLGFFYVKINHDLAILEFFNLLSKIPWETLCAPGLNQIPYITIAQLLDADTDTAIQLMVLGDAYKFWILINPYNQMTKTTEMTKLLISCMGTLAIRISPNFIKNCQQFVESVILPKSK